MANPKIDRTKEYRDAQRRAERKKAEQDKKELLSAYLGQPNTATGLAALRQSQMAAEIQRMAQQRLQQAVSGMWASSFPSPTITPFWPEMLEKVPPFDSAKLESLKTVEPYKVTKRQPDYMEVITAWRAWKVKGQRLVALGSSGTWEPLKAMEAVCNQYGEHPAPQMDCSCGIWAFKDLARLTGALSSYSNIRVLGKVSLWGRVVETENGYRAEKAYPAELWLLDDSLEELGLIYDVPVRKA